MQNPFSILAAFGAIVLWASLAMTSKLLAGIPPFYQLSVAFFIGALPVLTGPSAFPPLRVLALGVAGLFGYHFFLFTAFRLAPPVEANLINYLWPMFMVLLAPLFFSQARLTRGHLVGAALALLGVVVLVSNQSVSLSGASVTGYLCALAAALTWPVYSLLKSRTPQVALKTTGGICLVAGALSLATHAVTEVTPVPTSQEWGLLLWLGIGPFGAAFYLWDFALKKGDPRLIGSLSYLTPVLSTVFLVFVANQSASTSTWVAMLLMTLGSLVGGRLSR